MSRLIKFRAWDVEGKCWIPEDQFHVDASGKLWTISEVGDAGTHWAQEVIEYILVQYTGLKDKSGKEIYEGDILATPQYEDKFAVVEWAGNHFGMGFSMMHDGMAVDMEDDWSDFEIIGNIYKNPELLK